MSPHLCLFLLLVLFLRPNLCRLGGFFFPACARGLCVGLGLGKPFTRLSRPWNSQIRELGFPGKTSLCGRHPSPPKEPEKPERPSLFRFPTAVIYKRDPFVEAGVRGAGLCCLHPPVSAAESWCRFWESGALLWEPAGCSVSGRAAA